MFYSDILKKKVTREVKRRKSGELHSLYFPSSYINGEECKKKEEGNILTKGDKKMELRTTGNFERYFTTRKAVSSRRGAMLLAASRIQ